MVSSFGMPTLFSEVLPNALGVTVFHTYVSRPDVSIASLISPGSRGSLMGLLARQSAFLALFAATLLVLFVFLRKLWSDE
jgi:hypothetical protein